MISDLTKEEFELIEAIANRSIKELELSDKMGIIMDIGYVHTTCIPLKLKDMLTGERQDFAHDIHGIYKHWNRRDLKMDGGFLPRFAKV